jgi:uncharacterized protein (DUF1800 family)
MAIFGADTITVKPTMPSAAINQTVQFTAQVSGASSSAVTWSAGGVVGGNATAGTISSTGLYTAPAKLPGQNPVQIVATSTANSKVQAVTYVNILSLGPVIKSVSPNPLPVGTITVAIEGTGFVAGATVMNSGVQLDSLSVTSTTVTATGYQGPAASATFKVKNPGSIYSNSITIPVAGSSSTTFMLTVVNGTGSGTYAAGAVVPISASTAPAGKAFADWTGASVANASAASTTLVMPAGNTTVTANYSTSGPSTFTLSVVNGTGSGTYAAGTSVAIAANPAPAGDAFANWTGATVVNALSSSTTLAMRAANTTVTANYASPPPITQVNPTAVPLGVFSLTITGTGFTSASQATLGGTALATTFVSATQLSASGSNSNNGVASLVVTSGSLASPPFSVQEGSPNALVTASAASRFLRQAAFGPSPADSASVQQLGFQAWLAAQFAISQVSTYQRIVSDQGGLPNEFLTNAVMNPDQLRQRVAFALSQIFVTSINTEIWNQIEGPYQDMLLADAFVNFRQILQDVTLSPAMGQFLNMANNGKANAANTILPNENFAREIMQLMSIGTTLLNPDGTPQLDSSNNPIATYYQPTISQFARVFTGWTYAPTTAGGAVNWGAYINPSAPMVPYELEHDTGYKTLLNGLVTPANQTAQQDLTVALDNIFNHQNVGPFIGKQLIRFLVKSNPSPAYVGRVAAAFNNNGKGVRGDMVAVATAVLLDPEARQNDNGQNQTLTDGHLTEPGLFMAGFLRGLGGTVNDQNYFAYDLANMGQDIYNPPSVFNYWSPGYVIPQTTVTGGEFEIYTLYSAIYRDNLIANLFSNYSGDVQTHGPGTTVDLTAFVNLASQPTALVNALDIALTDGLMPAQRKQTLVSAVQAESGGPLRQVQTAIYLILASGYYNVWH